MWIQKKQKGEIDQSRFLDSICQPTNFNQLNERKGDSLWAAVNPLPPHLSWAVSSLSWAELSPRRTCQSWRWSALLCTWWYKRPEGLYPDTGYGKWIPLSHYLKGYGYLAKHTAGSLTTVVGNLLLLMITIISSCSLRRTEIYVDECSDVPKPKQYR